MARGGVGSTVIVMSDYDRPVFTPSLRASLPQGWFAKESITLLAPDGQANVIASSEPLDPSIDTNQYAQVQGDLLRKEFPGYEEMSFEPRSIFGGRPGWRRWFSWTPPDGLRVTQIQFYFAESGRGYTATATTPSRNFERYEQTLIELLDSLAIGR